LLKIRRTRYRLNKGLIEDAKATFGSDGNDEYVKAILDNFAVKVELKSGLRGIQQSKETETGSSGSREGKRGRKIARNIGISKSEGWRTQIKLSAQCSI
jgi:hypothetical protein